MQVCVAIKKALRQQKGAETAWTLKLKCQKFFLIYLIGLFDERLHQILEDPGDDTKGFLDPNTRENLTYIDLMDRCIEDPETKLLLVPIVRKEDRKIYKEKWANYGKSLCVPRREVGPYAVPAPLSADTTY